MQATFQGFLSAGLFFFVANAKPRKTLSSARPHQSVFSPYVMLSLLGQFAVQIGFIVYMFRRSYAATDPVRSPESLQAACHTTCYLHA
jgi:magnesium-transporting ATPase (P-type)